MMVRVHVKPKCMVFHFMALASRKRRTVIPTGGYTAPGGYFMIPGPDMVKFRVWEVLKPHMWKPPEARRRR